METLELNPDGHLGEFIEKIYVNYSDSFEYQGIAEPFLNPEIFFSFGTHFQIGQESFSTDGRNTIAIIGNRSTSVPVRAYGNHYTAGVIFKPWGIYSTFDLDGKLTVNQLLKITSTSGFKEFVNFTAFKNIAPDVMLEILESTIKKVVGNRSIKDNFQKSYYIVNSMSMGQANMNEVASKVDLSQKTVIKLFNEHLGISPLKYIHVKTIIESLRSLKSSKKISLTGLALDLGFYDQSHFIRVFKSCMGMTPSEFISYNNRTPSRQEPPLQAGPSLK